MVAVRTAALLMVCAISASTSSGRQGLALQPVATGLAIPSRIAFPPDGSGRLFFLELRTGNVRVIENDTLRALPWAHVDVSTLGERGLLGLAFDPGFAVNGHVYLYYTAPGLVVTNRVVRLTDSGGVASTSDVVTLYEMEVSTPCVTTFYHNAGALACPLPGELYISTGDNRCPQLSGAPDDPRGKILRVDPRVPAPFNAVAANHWYDDGDPASGNDDRIFAAGFRNPYGMTVDPDDFTLYVSENGPDCNDEINRVSGGEDYGWRPACDTGPEHCSCPQDSPWTPPLWKVSPTISPTGIVVYRGDRYPFPSGTLLFTSYNDGLIRGGLIDGSDTLEVSVFANPGAGALLDIAASPDSVLYVSSSQAIYRVVPNTAGVRDAAPGPGETRMFAAADGEVVTVNFTLRTPGLYFLEIFDVTGRRVFRREERAPVAGTRSERFPVAGYSAGVYFIRVLTAAEIVTGKFPVMK